MFFVVYHVDDPDETVLNWWVEGPYDTREKAENMKKILAEDISYDQIYITTEI